MLENIKYEILNGMGGKGKSKRRGSYATFSLQQQAAISKYASLNMPSTEKDSIFDHRTWDDLFVCTWNISK